MKLGELVKIYRENHDLSQRAFGKQCGMSGSYVSLLESGINPNTGAPIVPTLDTIKKLADAMHITVHELIGQVDDLGITLSTPPEFEALPQEVKNRYVYTTWSKRPLEIPQRGKGRYIDRGILRIYYDTSSSELSDVRVPSYSNADYAMICPDDSMIGDRIVKGDYLCICLTDQIETGDIVAVILDGSITLRRIYIRPTYVFLDTSNSAVPPTRILSDEATEKIEIVGKVVASIVDHTRR